MRIRTDRKLIVVCLLSIITFGIYPIYFWYQYVIDVNKVCKDDGDDTLNFILMALLSSITFGIYYFFWVYKLGNRLKFNGERYGIILEKDGNSLVLWSTFGCLLFGMGPFIASYHMIHNLNKVAAEYNKIKIYPLPSYKKIKTPEYHDPAPAPKKEPDIIATKISSPTDLFCENCGEALTDTMLYCMNCGEKISESTAESEVSLIKPLNKADSVVELKSEKSAPKIKSTLHTRSDDDSVETKTETDDRSEYMATLSDDDL